MRIVKWDEFQKLPEGTVFQQVMGNGGSLGELMILGEILLTDGKATDFLEAQLTPGWNDEDSVGEDGRRHLGIPDGVHLELFAVPQGFGRDGLYDYDRSWLVWEQADRERLAGWLLDPEKALMQMNDEPHAHLIIPRDWA